MIKSLRGMEDILPEQIPIWRYIEDTSRRIFSLYGYKEIRTPIIEESALFVRGIGEDTDIVKKQMYSFKEQGGRNICLRPEETASVVRAYLEHHLAKKEGLLKLFYIGPMFRSERPQAGRLRQFHQVGVEAIGSCSPYIDAEVLLLLDDLLSSYKLSDYHFRVNSLGCKIDKDKIKLALGKELKYHLNALCGDCQRRYETNILRIFDCKKASCQKIVKSLSSVENFLCPDCTGSFQKLKDILDESGLKYEVSPSLVRGLDYYTKVVFEVTTKQLGAQDAVAGGGRYDNLVSEFGGPQTGACGFAIGMERVFEVRAKLSTQETKEAGSSIIYIVCLGEESYREGFKILRQLRESDLAADIDYQQKSLKAQMRYADKLKAGRVVILGEDELKANTAIIRDMRDGSQRMVALDRLVETLRTQN